MELLRAANIDPDQYVKQHQREDQDQKEVGEEQVRDRVGVGEEQMQDKVEFSHDHVTGGTALLNENI